MGFLHPLVRKQGLIECVCVVSLLPYSHAAGHLGDAELFVLSMRKGNGSRCIMQGGLLGRELVREPLPSAGAVI